MKYKLVGVISLIILLIVVDQLSKYLFYNLQVGSNIFFLYPLLNEGISWGLSMPMFITITVSIVCSVLFIYLYYKKYLTAFEFALLFAGTIGNFVDRIFLGGVRDFLSFGSFPVFNIADSFLTCGVAWICIKEIFHLQNKQKNLP